MNKSNRDKILLLAGALAFIIALALVLLLLYALNVASVGILRAWAGIATVTIPLASLVTFHLGRLEARGHIAGLTQGIEAVSRAAQNTADIRVTAAHRLRQKPTPSVQQLILPAGIPGSHSTPNIILPPHRHEEDIEL